MLKIEKVRTILLGAALLGVFIVIGTALNNSSQKAVVPEEPRQRTEPDNATLKLNDVSYSTVNENNIKVWDLKAESANYYNDRELLALKEVVVKIYSDNSTYRMTGHSGEFNTHTRDIKVEGDAEALLPDGTVFKTDTLRYDHKRRIMTTKDKVLITRGNISIDGVGVLINLNDKKLLILDKVRASQNAN